MADRWTAENGQETLSISMIISRAARAALTQCNMMLLMDGLINVKSLGSWFHPRLPSRMGSYINTVFLLISIQSILHTLGFGKEGKKGLNKCIKFSCNLAVFVKHHIVA